VQKTIELENLKRANKSYSIFDFIFSPLTTFFEIMVSSKRWFRKKIKPTTIVKTDIYICYPDDSRYS
jgi:hypothetical protein